MPLDVPEDLLLPSPQDTRERDIFNSLQDAHRQLAIALLDLVTGTTDTDEKVKGTSVDPSAGYLDAKVDDSTITVSSNLLTLKADGILHTHLNSDVITSATDHSITTGDYILFSDSGDGGDLKKSTITDLSSIVGSDSTKIVDADGDTKVDTEESADEDVIRFDVAASEIMTIDADGLSMAAGVAINEFSNDTTFGGDSDTAVPTEKAVKDYVDNFLLSGAKWGDVWFVTSKDAGVTLEIEKLSPTKYGHILVCGGADADVFWDSIDGAPGGLAGDFATINAVLTNPVLAREIITLDHTRDITITLNTTEMDLTQNDVAKTDDISITFGSVNITMDQEFITTQTLDSEITYTIA